MPLPSNPIEYKTKYLLYDLYSDDIDGPVLHELTQDFHHASIYIRKESMIKRAPFLKSTLNMTLMR